jgi:2-hydroxyglutarate dehydrogenase
MINHLLPPESQRQQYFCKGSYFGYTGPGCSQVQRLIYPCPEPNVAGLGTHLTMNLAGEIRFGPDVEWLEQPDGAGPDFWQSHLAPSSARHQAVFDAVRQYLPGVSYHGLHVDCKLIATHLPG